MDQDSFITAIIVVAAFLFVGRRLYGWFSKAGSGKVGCGNDCGCGPDQSSKKP